MVHGDGRLEDPWGVRTPYASGEQWPPRVDLRLADGVAEDDVHMWVHSASLLQALSPQALAALDS